jgi:hypothetical protein
LGCVAKQEHRKRISVAIGNQADGEISAGGSDSADQSLAPQEPTNRSPIDKIEASLFAQNTTEVVIVAGHVQ